MTVGDLKKQLAAFPDDLEVVTFDDLDGYNFSAHKAIRVAYGHKADCVDGYCVREQTEVVMLVEEAAAKATLAVASDTLMKSLFGA